MIKHMSSTYREINEKRTTKIYTEMATRATENSKKIPAVKRALWGNQCLVYDGADGINCLNVA